MANGWGGKRPGAGRPKGSPNKRTNEVKARLEELGVDPIDVLAEFANSHEDDRLRAECAKALLPYLHPRLSVQNIDLTAAVESGPLVIVRDAGAEAKQSTD